MRPGVVGARSVVPHWDGEELETSLLRPPRTRHIPRMTVCVSSSHPGPLGSGASGCTPQKMGRRLQREVSYRDSGLNSWALLRGQIGSSHFLSLEESGSVFPMVLFARAQPLHVTPLPTPGLTGGIVSHQRASLCITPVPNSCSISLFFPPRNNIQGRSRHPHVQYSNQRMLWPSILIFEYRVVDYLLHLVLLLVVSHPVHSGLNP